MKKRKIYNECGGEDASSHSLFMQQMVQRSLNFSQTGVKFIFKVIMEFIQKFNELWGLYTINVPI